MREVRRGERPAGVVWEAKECEPSGVSIRPFPGNWRGRLSEGLREVNVSPCCGPGDARAGWSNGAKAQARVSKMSSRIGRANKETRDATVGNGGGPGYTGNTDLLTKVRRCAVQ